jgi:hypothetical protein
MRVSFALIAALAMLFGSVARTDDAPPAAPRALIEIYRIAPGQHEQFLRMIARADEANTMAGLPPRQLYVHQDGADWDFILIQPAKTPPEKADALDAAWTKLGLPSGPDFFIEFRRFIAEHSDTFAEGPTSAAAWLSRLAKSESAASTTAPVAGAVASAE